jgi:tRNA modification GTPase
MIFEKSGMNFETIIAPATALERSAIGLVRISGARALELTISCARRKSRGSTPTSPLKNAVKKARTSSRGDENFLSARRATLCEIVDPQNGRVIDDALVTFFKGPASYTGEDLVEISCHGNTLIIKTIVEIFIKLGARLARPGEFTRRAYLSGRMTLLEAEAVERVIEAENMDEIEAARKTDVLERRINEWKNLFLGIIAKVEASIDFPEDEIEDVTCASLLKEISDFTIAVESLLVVARRKKGRPRVALVGKPNVGKSSLFNKLLEFDRAIVTHIAGTTRDPLSEELVIDGASFELVDTAGIEESDSHIARLAMERTMKWRDESDIVIEIQAELDKDTALDQEESAGFRGDARQRVIRVMNKSDLLSEPELASLKERTLMCVSAKTGEGIDVLKKEIVKAARSLDGASGKMILSVRQKSELEETLLHLRSAGESLKSGVALDAVTVDLRAALCAVSRLDGTALSEEILDRIFRDFCIGK